MAYYNCLLLDADGTLLDFDTAEQRALRETLEQFDLPTDDATVRTYQEINDKLWRELEEGTVTQSKLCALRFSKLLTALGKEGDGLKMNEAYLDNLSKHCETMPGAEEALQDLAEVATLVLVSNGFERVQMSRINDSGLAKYFDGFFISGRVGAAKPNRKIFDVALEQMGVNKRDKVLVVGDSLSSDIRGGNAAELTTCWVNWTGEENASGIHPNMTVRNLEELYPIVMEEEELNNVGNTEKHRFL